MHKVDVWGSERLRTVQRGELLLFVFFAKLLVQLIDVRLRAVITRGARLVVEVD